MKKIAAVRVIYDYRFKSVYSNVFAKTGRKINIMDKLHFLTAGQHLSTVGSVFERAFLILFELKLDGMELEFVHGIRISEKSKNQVKNASKNKVLTAHAPFYINLNAKEPEKIEQDLIRLIPKEYWNDVNHLLIWHGRNICVARSP